MATTNKLIVALWMLIAISACGTGEQKSVLGAHSQENVGAAFLSVKVEYEVLQSGERVKFDFIQSCYNSEIKGSFAGELMPPNIFAATATGQAIAITIPSQFCLNLTSGRDILAKKNPIIEVPILAWYEDVNDLSRALVYNTNDAYLGASAKVRFIDFSVSETDKKSYYDWVQRAKDSYQQIGAIPGPFGCYSGGAEDTCGQPEVTNRNNGKRVVVPQFGNSATVTHAPDMLSAFNGIVDTSHYFSCEGGYQYETDEFSSWQDGPSKVRAMWKVAKPKIADGYNSNIDQWDHYDAYQIYDNGLRVSHAKKVLLDLQGLKTGTPRRDIIEIYPWNEFCDKTKRCTFPEVEQVLYAPEWRGFTFLPKRSDLAEFNSMDALNSDRLATLFFNTDPVCTYDSGVSGKVYFNFKDKITLRKGSVY